MNLCGLFGWGIISELWVVVVVHVVGQVWCTSCESSFQQ